MSAGIGRPALKRQAREKEKMDYRDYLEVGEYKGNPTLTIPVGFNQNFTFGFTKAVIIANHEAELRTFVEKDGKGAGNPSIVISEYKGHPIIELPTHKPKYPIRLGLSKARACLSCMTGIAEFIIEHEGRAFGIASESNQEEIAA